MHSAPQMSTCPPVNEFTIFKSFQSNLIVGALIQVYNVVNETSDGVTHIVCKTTCCSGDILTGFHTREDVEAGWLTQ